MDNAILAIFTVAVGVAAVGARMMYCGHHRKANPNRRRNPHDRRHFPRTTDRRGRS